MPDLCTSFSVLGITMTLNGWKLIGWAGALTFGMRFLIQWIASERAKKSVIPFGFWEVSAMGSMLSITYFAIYRQDSVGVFQNLIPLPIYLRNIYFRYRKPRAESEDDPAVPPRSGYRTKGIVAFSALTLLVIAMGWWMWPQPKLPSRGGLYFPSRVEIEVPAFAQSDPRWAADLLGHTAATLQAEGCAVASAAMIMASYGVATDPGHLNRYLTENAGYEGAGWIIWEKTAELTEGHYEKSYENKASFVRIDLNLIMGNPVIVRVRYPSGTTHFVVIVGKDGWDYLIRDPGKEGERGVYPLSELAPHVEALRYYRRIP